MIGHDALSFFWQHAVAHLLAGPAAHTIAEQQIPVSWFLTIFAIELPRFHESLVEICRGLGPLELSTHSPWCLHHLTCSLTFPTCFSCFFCTCRGYCSASANFICFIYIYTNSLKQVSDHRLIGPEITQTDGNFRLLNTPGWEANEPFKMAPSAQHSSFQSCFSSSIMKSQRPHAAPFHPQLRAQQPKVSDSTSLTTNFAHLSSMVSWA